MAQKIIHQELLDAFYSFLEYTDPKMLSRILRIQFIEYCQTLPEGVLDKFDSHLYHLTILFEFLDAIDDHTPFKYENG